MRPSPHAVGAILLLLTPAPSQGQRIEVTLLGTGAPPPEIERFGPSTLVLAGSERLLFDVGRGTTQRLSQLDLGTVDIDAVFLTHLHADHTVGLPDLWLMSALRTPSPLDVFGPEGTEDMLLNLREAYGVDPRMRVAADATSTHLVAEGVVYERSGVKVTAFRVDHAAGSTPAFGYRIDFADRSVVISGDTRPSDNLLRFAEGADVLLHEVIAARPGALRASERAAETFAAHTSPEDAGRLFDRLRPELAVYTHVSLLAGPAARAALASEILPRTRSTYAGPVIVGEDLMTVIVDERVDVRPFAGSPR